MTKYFGLSLLRRRKDGDADMPQAFFVGEPEGREHPEQTIYRSVAAKNEFTPRNVSNLCISAVRALPESFDPPFIFMGAPGNREAQEVAMKCCGPEAVLDFMQKANNRAYHKMQDEEVNLHLDANPPMLEGMDLAPGM